MKNNKKIYLLTALTMLACGQELSAMGAARKATQFIWNNKFALGSIGMVGAAAFEYKKCKQEPIEAPALIESKKTTSDVAVMAPIKKTLTHLLGQKHSPETSERIKNSVDKFIANQHGVAKNFKKLIESHMGGTVVAGFNIPEESTKEIKEKLSPFTSQPVFFRSEDEDPIPQLQTVKAFGAVGFSMNWAAERAFWNADTVFNRAQMEAVVDHECLHVEHGDGDLKVLFIILSQNREHFSDEEFYKIMGAFGEDFLNHRKPLIAAITKEANEMGIRDLSRIENFDMDATAFQRYFETRVDETILASKDKKKMKAYRDNYKNCHDSQAVKKRMAADKANVSFCLRNGRAIPLSVADLVHPTDLERVNACDKALAELEAANK